MAQVYVVIPCYREPLDEVRRSVQSALDVPIDGLRVIVVDDGCNDESLDVLHDEYACLDENAVTVIHRAENGGPSAALDTGIRATPSDAVICRLDVRDEFYPEPKARQIETVLNEHAASCSPHFDPVENRVFQPADNWRQRIYTDSCFTGVSTVYRRSVWERVGIDTSFRWAEDWRFSLLIEHLVGFDMFPEVTCSAGMFPGGHTDCGGDRAKRKLRDADRARVLELGRALSHPDEYAHLYSDKWCQKHGKVPLRRRRP